MACNESPKPTESWAGELRKLNERLKDVDVEKIHLAPGWDKGKDDKERWQRLRDERDLILIIKTKLGWLSIDAAATVDRRLRTAGEIIDATIEGRVSEAALKLGQAEDIMQRAWWSRHWNSWRSCRWNSWRCRWIPPMWILLSMILAAALGATAWAIFDRELFPRGEDIELPDALFGATLWGFAGALITGLRTLHHRVQSQQFERARIAWYLLSPVIGLAFGAIAFLLFLTGLLSTGQDLEAEAASTAQQQAQATTKVIDPTPILVLALLAGFAQNAFIGALQQIIRARFRGAAEEEETPV